MMLIIIDGRIFHSADIIADM